MKKQKAKLYDLEIKYSAIKDLNLGKDSIAILFKDKVRQKLKKMGFPVLEKKLITKSKLKNVDKYVGLMILGK